MIFYLIRTVSDDVTMWWNGYKWVDRRDQAMEYTEIAQLMEGMSKARPPWQVIEVNRGNERISFDYPSR